MVQTYSLVFTLTQQNVSLEVDSVNDISVVRIF